jgi:hypothetical protein
MNTLVLSPDAVGGALSFRRCRLYVDVSRWMMDIMEEVAGISTFGANSALFSFLVFGLGGDGRNLAGTSNHQIFGFEI